MENNFRGKGINLNASLSLSEEKVKGMFSYTHPNFNYSDRSLTTSIQSTSTDKITDYGYKSSLNAISLGTSYEQYENLFFKLMGGINGRPPLLMGAPPIN